MIILVPGTQGQTSQRTVTFIGLKTANIQHLLTHILLASLGPGTGLHLMFSKWVGAACPRGRYGVQRVLGAVRGTVWASKKHEEIGM